LCSLCCVNYAGYAGYLQGVQGAELKGTHAHEQEFFKGYFKEIQGYWWNRGLAEGYRTSTGRTGS